MEDTNLILNLPFDESDGSTTAYDYSQSHKNATVHDCPFVDGKQGKAIKFDGNGYADIANSNIDLTGNFTLLAWIKTAEPDIAADHNIGLYLQYGNGVGKYIQRYYSVSPDSWVYWAVVKEGLTVKVYKDTQLVDTITLASNLVVMAVNQNIYNTENGFGCLDELKVYNVAASEQDIIDSITSANQLIYSINGKPFVDTWGIYVESSDGLLDRPALKTPFSQDWPGYHGEVVDLDNKRVQPRDITLKCWMQCTGKMDFVQKWNDFCSQFEADGTARLMVDIHPTRPLVYEVYLREALNVSKKWNDALFVATFTLKVREPDPVKRVVRFRNDSGSEQHTIKLNTDGGNVLTIAWGDGTFTHNVYGDHTSNSTALKHTYSTNGVFYAIISGIIDDEYLTDFETDGIVIWNKF